MSSITIPAQNSRFKVGWFSLLISTGLMAAGHFFMIFTFDEPVLFTDFTAFNLLAFFIVFIPFRRGEKWAWLASWTLPLVYAVTAINDLAIAVYFIGFAALCGLGLLLTMGDFFTQSR
jgi:hypothetical protein